MDVGCRRERERHILRRCKYSVADESMGSEGRARHPPHGRRRPLARWKGGVLPLECEYLYGVHLTQDHVDGDLPNN